MRMKRNLIQKMINLSHHRYAKKLKFFLCNPGFCPYPPYSIYTNNKTDDKGATDMKNHLKNKLLALALTVSLSATLAACSNTPQSTASAEDTPALGTILLSVNPEIEVEYDKDGIVLEIEGVNNDGKSVVTDYTDYQGKSCAEVVKELVQEIYDDGYFEKQLDGHAKNIVVKLEDGSFCPSNDFLEEVANGVRQAVKDFGGKSGTILVDNDDLDNQGLIGIAKARELVLTQLGLTDATFSEGNYDLEDGVYEFEFTANGIEYEYEVDAVTGKILEADYEHNDDWDSWNDDDDDDLDDNDEDDVDDRDDNDEDDIDDWDDNDEDDIDDWDDNDEDDVDDRDDNDEDDVDDRDDNDEDDVDDRDDNDEDDVDDRDDNDEDDVDDRDDNDEDNDDLNDDDLDDDKDENESDEDEDDEDND